MTDLLVTVLAFLVALSVLIAVHELGHFWVARLLGVKVLRYSIGFGKPLWSRRLGADQTEYVVAAVPLGGYVKMLDEREAEVPPEEQHRAFNRQTVGRRFAIVFAGPFFNFLFAILAYWLMFVTGVPGLKAIIGEVEPGSLAAQAGLRSGQQITAVDGTPTPTWNAAFDAILPQALRQEPVTLVVEDPRSGAQQTHRLALDRLDTQLKPGELNERIGLRPFTPPIPPVIGEIASGSPAARAGLQSGDQVTRVDGQPVGRWEELVELIRRHPGDALMLTVERDGRTLLVEVVPESVEANGQTIGRLGAGVRIDPQFFEGLRAEQRFGPLAALPVAAEKTWDMSTLTLRMLWEMLVGRASVENISGPITIAVYARASAVAGVAQFLAFLAIVSISLGILNLLPIPILDGGHLFYFLIEMVKGRPVSERTQAIGQRIGLALILALMFLAFYNDLVRLAE